VSSCNPPGPLEGYPPEKVAGIVAANGGKWHPGNGIPWAMPVQTLREVGLFDEGYVGSAGYEDWDHNNCVLDRGYQVLIALDSVVWHDWSAIRKGTATEEDTLRNRERYMAKWGSPGPRV